MTFLSTTKNQLWLCAIAVFFLFLFAAILLNNSHSEKKITQKKPSFQQVIETIKPDIPITTADENLVVKSKKELTSVLIESYDTPVNIAQRESIAKVYKIHPCLLYTSPSPRD